MGRKGVSKRKKAKSKVAPVGASNSASNGRMAENQPAQVSEKGKTWSKDNKKR